MAASPAALSLSLAPPAAPATSVGPAVASPRRDVVHGLASLPRPASPSPSSGSSTSTAPSYANPSPTPTPSPSPAPDTPSHLPALHAPVPPFALAHDAAAIRLTLAVNTTPGRITAAVRGSDAVHITLPDSTFALRLPIALQTALSLTHASHSTVVHLRPADPPATHIAHVWLRAGCAELAPETQLRVAPVAAFCAAVLDARADAPDLVDADASHPFGHAHRFTYAALSGPARAALRHAVVLPRAHALPPWRRAAARAGLEDRDLVLDAVVPDSALPAHDCALRAPPKLPGAREARPCAAALRAPAVTTTARHAAAVALPRARDHDDAAAVATSVLAAMFAARRATGALDAGCAHAIALLAPPLAALDGPGSVSRALRDVARRSLVYGGLRAPRLGQLAASDVADCLRGPTGAARASARAWVSAVRAWFAAAPSLCVHVLLTLDPLLGWLAATPDAVVARWAAAVRAAVDGGVADVGSLEWPPHVIVDACRCRARLGAASLGCAVSPVKAERVGPPSDKTTTSSSSGHDGTTSSSPSASC